MLKHRLLRNLGGIRKKFQEAVTTAQGTTTPAGTVAASPGTMSPVTRTTTKRVTFAQPLVETKNKNKGDPKGKAETGSL